MISVNLKKFKRGQCNFYPVAKTKILTTLDAPQMYILTCKKPVLEFPSNSVVLDPSACRLNTLRTGSRMTIFYAKVITVNLATILTAKYFLLVQKKFQSASRLRT